VFKRSVSSLYFHISYSNTFLCLDLKLRIRELENEYSDLQFLKSQHLARIKTLEQEYAQKTRKIVQLQGKSVHTVISPRGKKF
jgi:hypothetical protein